MKKKFGNWEVSKDGISWDEQKPGIYFIPINRLLELRGQEKLYDWLTHLTEKTWLNDSDLYHLNDAFLYAAKKYGFQIDKKIYDQSVILQQAKIENRHRDKF
jgi:hypothetical protein